MNEQQRNLTDGELVRLALQKDEAAFGVLALRHRQKCMDVACSFLRNSTDAEDEVQNALLKAFERLEQYQGEAEFVTWLSRIVANQCLMLIRSRKTARFVYLDETSTEEKALPAELPSRDCDPEGELAYFQLNDVLRTEVGRIPRLMRNVMVLRDIQGLPMRDVADNLGITVSAAKSRLSRARTELRSRMTKHYGGIRDNSPLDRCAAPLSRVGRHCPMMLAS